LGNSADPQSASSVVKATDTNLVLGDSALPALVGSGNLVVGDACTIAAGVDDSTCIGFGAAVAGDDQVAIGSGATVAAAAVGGIALGANASAATAARSLGLTLNAASIVVEAAGAADTSLQCDINGTLYKILMVQA
jgi:hypothetical protein